MELCRNCGKSHFLLFSVPAFPFSHQYFQTRSSREIPDNGRRPVSLFNTERPQSVHFPIESTKRYYSFNIYTQIAPQSRQAGKKLLLGVMFENVCRIGGMGGAQNIIDFADVIFHTTSETDLLHTFSHKSMKNCLAAGPEISRLCW